MSLNAWQIGLIAYYAFSSLVVIAFIGRERKPTKPLEAVIMVILYGVLVWVVTRT